MNHNPHNFKEGEIVILDAEMAIGGPVKIVFLTEKGIYTEVSDGDDSWYVMTARLSPQPSIRSDVK